MSNPIEPPGKAPIYLLDGGLGTTLSDIYSVTFDSSTPLWSSTLLLTDPNTLQAAQTAFADAGADIILTATYQASFEGFGVNGREDARIYMRSAIPIARSAFGSTRKGKVALSLGAYGATMVPSTEYTGLYDEARRSVQGLKQWHAQRIGVFSTGDDVCENEDMEREEARSCWEEIDLVAFETLPLLQEVIAVREVMFGVFRERGVEEKPFWISCVFPGEGRELPDGSCVEDTVKAMLGNRKGASRPKGVGINCTKIGKVKELVEEFEKAIQYMLSKRDLDEWPALVLYPDGTDGEVYNTATKEWEMLEKAETEVGFTFYLMLMLRLQVLIVLRYNGTRL